MIDILLEQKPDINLEQLKELIEEKKRKIGAGYLTDQGALFLVAADLGASFDNVQRTKRGIKDLYIGARDLDLTVRLLSTYPIRVFTKKDTNERIENRTISVRSEEHTSELQSLMRISYAVFCLNKKTNL